MEKDKESMAMLQNKRQEFRCSQVVRAVNKEKNLRERELSHESKQFEAKLQKLIDKRKELNLDSTKTRELEMFLSPRLRTKSRCPSPERKVSPGALPGLKVTDDAGNDVFVTNFSRLAIACGGIENAATNFGDGNNNGKEVKTLEVYKKLIKSKETEKGKNDNRGKGGSDMGKTLQEDTVHTKLRSKTIPVEKRQETSLEAEKSGGLNTVRTHAFRRSASDLQVKLSNVQQWLNAMETVTESKPFVKRHSTSS